MRIPFAAVLALVLLPVVASPIHALEAGSRGWTSLGDLHVRDGVDRDTLRVGAKKGRFEAIRFKVIGRAVQFHDLKVHFENGDVQDIPLRSVIRPGKYSRKIDLTGDQRIIEKIVFIFDAQTRRRGKGAKVEVFGGR